MSGIDAIKFMDKHVKYEEMNAIALGVHKDNSAKSFNIYKTMIMPYRS